MSLALAWALSAFQIAAAEGEPSSALLVAPAGFAVDLIDSAPRLLWPSAVHCRADGSLLVAEDPMDMPGPADQPIDRIWLYRWNADGGFTRTLFAEKLYATFGLEEIDGAIYVMNMPHLTVLRDDDGDGVAEKRHELLTDLGPPAPGWPGGFNDHIVSGLRYGMDGFLYVSVGDKGIPLAHGTDGRTLSLRGGGIVRLRPDGSELGVVARGLRNTLDVGCAGRSTGSSDRDYEPHCGSRSELRSDPHQGCGVYRGFTLQSGRYPKVGDRRDDEQRYPKARRNNRSFRSRH